MQNKQKTYSYLAIRSKERQTVQYRPYTKQRVKIVQSNPSAEIMTCWLEWGDKVGPALWIVKEKQTGQVNDRGDNEPVIIREERVSVRSNGRVKEVVVRSKEWVTGVVVRSNNWVIVVEGGLRL